MGEDSGEELQCREAAKADGDFGVMITPIIRFLSLGKVFFFLLLLLKTNKLINKF